MSSYFKLYNHIGSSLLSKFAESQDHALIEVKPSSFIEGGKIWEDWLEFNYAQFNFWDKYYLSKINNFPDSKNPKLTSIPTILETDNVFEAVDQAYIINKNGSINNRYKTRHNLLDEIKFNNYKKPIPVEIWSNFQVMFENFQKCEFNDDSNYPLDNLLKFGNFQTEYVYQLDDSDSEQVFTPINCRAKFDWEYAAFQENEHLFALVIDFKKTHKLFQFEQNWNKWYIWQCIHYSIAYEKYIKEKFNTWYPIRTMYFIVSEESPPYHTRIYFLKDADYELLKDDYFRIIIECWNWIQAGRPTKGWRKQKAMRYYRRKY